MKMIVNLFVALLFLVISGCGGGVRLRGVVRDKPTGNPLSSATVTIQGEKGGASATTDGMGQYQIKGKVKLPAQVTVNAPGYFMYSATLGERTQVMDFDLQPR